MHLQKVARHVNPAAFVLLNLSRDQLDRVGEIAKVERRIRETVEAYLQAVVVVNCDDPLISCASDGRRTIGACQCWKRGGNRRPSSATLRSARASIRERRLREPHD